MMTEKVVCSDAVDYANKIAQDEMLWFFKSWFFTGDLTDKQVWFYDPFSKKQFSSEVRHWSEESFFFAPGADIKCVWEQSRFYWMPILAMVSRYDDSYVKCLEKYFRSWCISNPPNQGLHWACGQEVSIRLCNFLLAQEWLTLESNDFLIEFIESHMERICHTLSYAKAQQNNHVISESVALIIGGLCLSEYLGEVERKQPYFELGLNNLISSLDSLVLADGGFSQYSITYHRMVLDAVSLCLLYLRKYKYTKHVHVLGLQHAKLAAWLHTFLNPKTKDVWNLGANDGALFFNIVNHDYRDFYYSVSLAGKVSEIFFCNGTVKNVSDILLSTDTVGVVCSQNAVHHDTSGVMMLKRDVTSLYLRYPNYKKYFRPGQCDSLHVDVWHRGTNVLIDSGTFSYNPALQHSNLRDTRDHNTLLFGVEEQMPLLSRFLYGNWLKYEMRNIDFKQLNLMASYSDLSMNNHRREVLFLQRGCLVKDTVRTSKTVEMSWHFGEEEVKLIDDKVETPLISLAVIHEGRHLVPKLVPRVHSLYYQHVKSHQTCVYSLPTAAHEAMRVETLIQFK